MEENKVQETGQKEETVIFAIVGWLFSFIGLLFFPPIFGSIAIVFGYMHRKNVNRTHGTVLMVAGVLSIIIGMILGAMVSVML